MSTALTGDVAGPLSVTVPIPIRTAARIAAGALELADAHLIGIIDGDHGIDLARCRQILTEARARGVEISDEEAKRSSIEILDTLAARDIAHDAAGGREDGGDHGH